MMEAVPLKRHEIHSIFVKTGFLEGFSRPVVSRKPEAERMLG
jgi:hypothetical protein